jgi:predicted ATPase/transcriptional regulator with XRE-family HTH domain
MTTRDYKERHFSTEEENIPLYFSEWVKGRRQELDLTQEQLAKRAFCSVHAVRKIEMGERRPSRQLAEVLAQALEIPIEGQNNFVQVARGERSVESLPSLTPDPVTPPAGASIPESGNLPRALTPFIGREPEINTLGQLLQDPQCSLLTIAGPGGIGKTRLAIEAACQARDLFPDGVWFVPLVSLSLPSLIIPAIAGALDFKFSDPTNLQAQLMRYLRTKKALLVLDNAEHLLEGVGMFTEILEGCPLVKLLVTSRERLSLLSEWVFEIQGLPVPHNDTVEQFDVYSSVALFLQSARRVRAGFEMRKAERQWVLKICQIMEGIPLGIELSAAWVGLLSCEEIAKEIEHNLDFLSVSLRDLPERHRSLRATLDHSWKLLNDEERLVLSRLSVLRGSFNLKAAQAICGASLVVLSSLRNKCLLYRTGQELYHLHEIIRQYAGLKLAEDAVENEQVKDRHASYYVQCLAKWEKALQSSRQLETFNEMAQVIDNLSQGWRYMLTHCRLGKDSRFCADSLHSALFSLSLEAIDLFKESVDSLKTVQAEFPGTEDYFRLTAIVGHITAYLGLHHYYIFNYEKGIEYLKEGIQLLDNSQSRVEKAQAQVILASFYYGKGQLQEAVILIKRCREVFREEGVKWWYALSTSHLGTFYLYLEKLQESEALIQEALQLVEPGDLRTVVDLRNSYAKLFIVKGDYDRAEKMLRDNLQLSYSFGNLNFIAADWNHLGSVALATGRIELAIECIQKSINLSTESQNPLSLGFCHLNLGKCYAARSNFKAARDQFRQMIKCGQESDRTHLVCSGLVNIARTYLAEGQIEKALEIALLLEYFPTLYKGIEDERSQLLADLQAALPEGQIEVAMEQINSGATQEQARAKVLAYVLEHETD